MSARRRCDCCWHWRQLKSIKESIDEGDLEEYPTKQKVIRMSLSRPLKGDFLILQRKLDSFDHGKYSKKERLAQEIFQHDHSYTKPTTEKRSSARKCCARFCKNTNADCSLFHFPSVIKKVKGQAIESKVKVERWDFREHCFCIQKKCVGNLYNFISVMMRNDWLEEFDLCSQVEDLD